MIHNDIDLSGPELGYVELNSFHRVVGCGFPVRLSTCLDAFCY